MNTSIPCYGIIPARYDSSRFPGKPLADIWGRPMFWHVYAHAKRASVLRNIVLATDDERIAEAALEWEIPCVMTRRDHASGTDRVFEAASKLGVEPHAVIVNIQGDEPALDPAVIEQLVRPFLDGTVQVSTLATPISPERAASPNQVKVVTAVNGDALYFSRSRIPFDREGGDGEILGHIGLYAFRMGALERFVSLPQSPLEKREKLEQLRFLENGVPIRVVRVEGYEAHGVDTPEDLEIIRELLAEHTCKSCVR
ncbi:3-deoxy-manno-octulosonate cytidylyltransferase [Bilophila wadsworthia]|uniref:3-deoxy-manno-octulosonate cytidylyltransferase n=1 Tax=Bilophila wadsworthia TaxID=35833 RepID=UPI0024332F51|nr:3-deoxy-manno-octulosonate cytidylyltransferase [Bilophila wadsworthia]